MNERDLPAEWKIGLLGDKAIAQTKSGGTPSRSISDYFGGDVPWVKSGELNDNYILSTEERITKLGLKNSSAKVFPKGTLLIALYGATAGKTAILNIEASTNQAVCAIFPVSESFDSGFLQYYLIYVRPRILGARSGGAQPNISQRVLSSLEVVLPPLPEQRAISRVLRAVQQAREARLREIALERERKAALMEHLFRHGTRGEATKETEIGEMPESWRSIHFEDITISGTQNGIYKNKKYYGNGCLIADMKDVFNGAILNPVGMDRVELDEVELKKFQLYDGDLLFARRSFKPEGSGKCQLVPLIEEPIVFSSSLIRVSLDPLKAHSKFYSQFFQSDIGYQSMKKIIRVLAVSGISGGDLKNLPVPFLLLSEQRMIAGILEACDAKIAALEHEARLHDELFRAMLEELMTGRLRAEALAETARLEAKTIQP